MDYCSYDKSTFEKSIGSIKNGDAEENWLAVEKGFGEKKQAIGIDKSWVFLSILFDNSEIGNFIVGTENETKFELEEVAVSIFSYSYLKTICDFANDKNLRTKETFINIAKTNNEFDESKADYYHENLVKLLDFYSINLENENWVLGLLM